MKQYIKSSLRLAAFAALAGGMMASFAACSDADMSATKPDYNPRYQGAVDTEAADFTVDANQNTVQIPFRCDMDWSVEVLNAEGEACDWATVTPAEGKCTTPGEPGVDGKEPQDFTITVTLLPNEDPVNTRSCQVVVATAKGGTQTFVIAQDYKVILLDPAQIQDYAKYICPESWNPHFEKGQDFMLRQDAYYSFHRMKQSEHFFVFWSPEFGDDPNAESVPAAMRVDIDDLLLKAERFFDTNINKLGMATLGQGKSMLDEYKMQIYLIYQDEWLATGSGYDNNIGALWVNPSTCQPVGSTIAHEIGHSFQYQTYCDRIHKQGATDDLNSGFRYGFIGPDGSGNGGCAYWEQCAQWQAHRDYPNEQFDSYNFPVWLANCHRHFHHEFQRYASYWLQTYWVNKQGIEAYGRIWTESVAPEDAIMAYTRLYNGNDYSKTREELFDYAVRMATYDIDGIREISGGYQGRYDALFYRNDDNSYQIAYENCPGATGFNVIQLDVPGNGGTVSVDFKGLPYGADLARRDKGNVEDGDGKTIGNVKKYNAVGGEENMGWRYGFVALGADGTRTYSEVGKDKAGNLSFTVPAGTELLYLVVQGSPEVYMSEGWDEDETNDPQFPYTIRLTGTDLSLYEEPAEFEYVPVDDNTLRVNFTLSARCNDDYAVSSFSISEQPILDFFGLSAEDFEAKLVDAGTVEGPTEGSIVMANLQSDGTFCYQGSSNNGYWVDANGDRCTWGDDAYTFSERYSVELSMGKFPGHNNPGDIRENRPAFIYVNGGVTKTVQFYITYRFK